MVSTVMKLVNFLYVSGKAQNRLHLIKQKTASASNLLSGRGGWYSQLKVVEMLANPLKGARLIWAWFKPLFDLKRRPYSNPV